MASLKLSSQLRAAQLKHAAFLMGLPTAGTKPELENSILLRLNDPPLLSRPTRLVSIDMGIKNLGICALEPLYLTDSMKTPKSFSQNSNEKSKLRVLAWKKLDVLSKIQPAETATPKTKEELDLAQPTKTKPRQKTSAPNPSAFAPSALSKVALSITQDILHTYKPTHILIERQRFRSGGASAVQEWTLRVNMLESMIWACLESLRVGKEKFPAVHEVSPARVAKFWCLGPSTIGTTPPPDLFTQGWKGAKLDAIADAVSPKTSKIEKKDKIAVVRSWLDGDKSESGDSTVALELSDEAMVVADSFLSDVKRGRSRKPSTQSSGKLDDLADCLLQGAAWIRWEENRQSMLKLLQTDATGR